MSLTGGLSGWLKGVNFHDEEDAKIFAAIAAAATATEVGAWVARLAVGDTVWLTKLNQWATVVAPWEDGKICLAYDFAMHNWHVSEDGRGLDGSTIMREYTRDRELALGDVNLSEVRAMVMVDVGREWKDVVTLLRDPMEVDGIEVGGTIWSSRGHSGDDDVELRLVYDTPSLEYVGKSGEKLRINTKLSLWLTLSNYDRYKYAWDIGSFVKDYEVNVFKAAEAMVMIALCEDPMIAVETRTWGILT